MDCLEIPVIWHVWWYTSVVAHVLVSLCLVDSNNPFAHTQAPQPERAAEAAVGAGAERGPRGAAGGGVAAAGGVSQQRPPGGEVPHPHH